MPFPISDTTSTNTNPIYIANLRSYRGADSNLGLVSHRLAKIHP